MKKHLKKYKILYAEDSLIMQKIIGRKLRKLDCEPIIVDNGLDARRILMDNDPPQIAILDWDMPGIDGVDICKEVKERQDGKFVYIMILTVHEEDDALTALEFGADQFIPKDAGIEAFSEALEEAVEKLESLV